MNRHMFYSIAIIAAIILIPLTSYASFGQSLTLPFGGKVLIANLPVATCIGFGAGPVVLSSNIGSLGSAVVSSTSTSQPTENRVSGTLSGLYGAIPFYASPNFSGNTSKFITPLPRNGDWILGRASIIPDFSRCYINGTAIPFPTRNTSNYNISR